MIVSSVISSQVTQPNGTINVTEIHTDHLGTQYPIVYNAPQGTNLNTLLTARATRIQNNLRDNDLNNAIFTKPFDYVLVHATSSELAIHVRELYKESIKEQTALIALRIIEWVANGIYTTTQIRNVFGLTSSQFTTLKTKMELLIADYQSVEGAVGE